jgi:hypothetical protein
MINISIDGKNHLNESNTIIVLNRSTAQPTLFRYSQKLTNNFMESVLQYPLLSLFCNYFTVTYYANRN